MVLGTANWWRSHERSGADTGLRIMTLEDLYRMGKPKGHGGVWKDTSVDAGETSDPFLVNGFDEKMLHLKTDTADTTFTIQVDFTGDGTWENYDTVTTSGTEFYPFPTEFNAVWVRLKSDTAATVTGWFNLG